MATNPSMIRIWARHNNFKTLTTLITGNSWFQTSYQAGGKGEDQKGDTWMW